MTEFEMFIFLIGLATGIALCGTIVIGARPIDRRH